MALAPGQYHGVTGFTYVDLSNFHVCIAFAVTLSQLRGVRPTGVPKPALLSDLGEIIVLD